MGITGKGKMTQPTAGIVQHSSVLFPLQCFQAWRDRQHYLRSQRSPLWVEFGRTRRTHLRLHASCSATIPPIPPSYARLGNKETKWGAFHQSPRTPRGRSRLLEQGSHERERCRCKSPWRNFSGALLVRLLRIIPPRRFYPWTPTEALAAPIIHPARRPADLNHLSARRNTHPVPRRW